MQMASQLSLPPAKIQVECASAGDWASAPGVRRCQADQRSQCVQAGLVVRQLRAVLGQAPEHLRAAQGRSYSGVSSK
jgi:hypothetical protein